MIIIRKGNFGEMATDVDLYTKGYNPLHNRTVDLDDTSVLGGGIDHVFQNPNTGEYIIVESKYNTSVLNQNPVDGPQMSNPWIQGGDRLMNVIGDEAIVEDIIMGGYTRVVAKVSPNGFIEYIEINSLGQPIGPWDH